MRIPNSGNVVAIALAGLAVVLAASGTAYAVTTSRVTVADPVHPSYRVRVDSKGNLKTVGRAAVTGRVAVSGPVAVVPPSATIDLNSTFGFDATTALSSPTTATLAVNSVSYSNPGLNSSFAGTDYNVTLVQIQAGTAGNCALGNAGVAITRQLGSRYVSPGDDIETAFPAPVLVRPLPGKKYCLGLSWFHIGSGAQTSLYPSSVQVTGSVVKGSYTGTGLATGAATPLRPAPALVTR